jgi:hypothetical protein
VGEENAAFAEMDWQKFMIHYRVSGGPGVNEQSLNCRNSIGANIGLLRIKMGYSDVRMIPLGSGFF